MNGYRKVLYKPYSVRMRFLETPLTSPLVPLAATLSKYSSLLVGSALMVLEPSVQLAGQTSPWRSYKTGQGWFLVKDMDHPEKNVQ